MTTQSQGYSGKPLFQKLGLKPNMSCLVIAGPDHFETLVAGAEDVHFTHADSAAAADGAYDAAHLFCATAEVLKENALSALNALAPGGMLWVSWPKKSSNLFVDLTENDIREVLLPTGWVDVKICALDGDWSGLKFLKRKPG